MKKRKRGQLHKATWLEKHKASIKTKLEITTIVLGVIKLIGDQNYQSKLNEIVVDSLVSNTLAHEITHGLFKSIQNKTTETTDFASNLQTLLGETYRSSKRLTEYLGDQAAICYWKDAQIPNRGGGPSIPAKDVTMDFRAIGETGPLKNYLISSDPPNRLDGQVCTMKLTLPGFSRLMKIYLQAQLLIEWLLILCAALLLCMSRVRDARH